MQNSMVMFTFSVSKWKYPFWANLVQKIKIVSLCWNLAPSLIWICRIQWWCWLLPFLAGNVLYGEIWSKKIKIVSLCWNLGPRLIQICRIQWWCSLFVFLSRNTFFGQIWSKKSMSVNLKFYKFRVYFSLKLSLTSRCCPEWPIFFQKSVLSKQL